MGAFGPYGWRPRRTSRSAPLQLDSSDRRPTALAAPGEWPADPRSASSSVPLEESCRAPVPRGWSRIHCIPLFTARTSRSCDVVVLVASQSSSASRLATGISRNRTSAAHRPVYGYRQGNRCAGWRCSNSVIALPTRMAASTVPCSSAATELADMPTETALTSSGERPLVDEEEVEDLMARRTRSGDTNGAALQVPDASNRPDSRPARPPARRSGACTGQGYRAVPTFGGNATASDIDPTATSTLPPSSAWMAFVPPATSDISTAMPSCW